MPNWLERLRDLSPLPAGSVTVGAGLGVNGLATYVFLAAARRSLDESGFDTVAVFWALIVVLGPGLFQALEQELSRLSAARTGQGLGAGGVLAPIAKIGGAAGVAGGTVILLASPVIADQMFSGDRSVVVALAGALLGYGVGHFVRGLLSGHGRFRGYGSFFALEGLGRAGGAIGLWAAGAATPARLAAVVAIAPLIAGAVVLWVNRDCVRPGPLAHLTDLSTALGWLLVGALLTGLMINIGPLAVRLLDVGEGEAGRFTSGLVVARIPLFGFQAVLAALLPSLAALASAGQLDEFRRRLGRLLAGLAVVGLLSVVVSAAAGPRLVSILLDHEISITDMGLMAGVMGLAMIAITIDQALIALGGHRRMAGGWFTALIAFCVLVLAGSGLDAFLRVELALLGSVVAAFAVMALALWRRLSPASADLAAGSGWIDPAGSVRTSVD